MRCPRCDSDRVEFKAQIRDLDVIVFVCQQCVTEFVRSGWDVDTARDARRLVLNVDDRPGALYARRRMLRQLGYLSIDVATAAEVLSKVRRSRPTAILLDVHLPDGDGRDLCRTLSTDELARDTPVILISATLDSFERVDLARIGASAFVREPVSLEQLSSHLRSVIGGS